MLNNYIHQHYFAFFLTTARLNVPPFFEIVVGFILQKRLKPCNVEHSFIEMLTDFFLKLKDVDVALFQTIAKDFTKSKRLRDTENSPHFLGTAVLESSSASLSCFSGLKLESVFSGLPTQNNLLDSTDAYHKDILAGDRSYRTRTAIQNISGGESSSGELLDSLDARRLELAAKKREYNRIKQREHRARLTPEEKRLKYQRRKELEMKRKTNIM